MEGTATTERAATARSLMDRVTEAATVKHDLDALAELYAPDCVIETPDAGTLRGRDGIVTWFGQFLGAFPDVSWEPTHSFESGDVAVDEGYVSGTNTGPLPMPSGEELAPTGKRVRVRSCDIARVEDGLVIEHRFYFDQLELLSQLGIGGEA
jgi:ketosteroid isomerase-like protein